MPGNRDPFSAARLSRAGSVALAFLVMGCTGSPHAEGQDGASRPAAQESAAPAAVPEDISTPYGDYLAARHAENTFDADLAAKLFARTLDRTPGNEILIRQTLNQMVSAGRVREAADLSLRALQGDPDSVIPGLVLAVDAVRQDRLADAENLLAAIPQRGLGSYFIPMSRAWVLAGLDRVDEALNVLSPLGQRRGLKNLHDLQSALLLDYAGRTDAARKMFDAIALNSATFVRSAQLVGNFYARHGAPEKARDVYERHLESQPDSPVIEAALARLEAGTTPAPDIRSPADGVGEAMLNLATLLHQENVQEIAMMLTRLALHVRPDYPVAQLLLGDIFAAVDRNGEAVGAYDSVPPDTPLSWEARLRAAQVLDRMDRTDAAIQRLRRMALEDETRSDALIALGDLLRFKKRYPESIDAYNRALARVGTLEPRHWALLYSRGIAYERSEQWASAEQDFLKALDFRPDQPLVLNYLGYSWIEKGERLERALDMIEKAVKLRPNDGFIIDSLGWAHYQLGNYEPAVKHLERAVELSPYDPTINDHLGDALWRVGRKLEARFQWRRALSFEPEPEDAAAIERKLAQGLGLSSAPKEASGGERGSQGG